MEGPETKSPECDNNIGKIYSINIKEYNINLKNDIYKLQIENSEEKILFKLRPINNITTYYFLKEYKYENIIKELNLSKKQYNNLTKVKDIIDASITNKNVKLIDDNKNMKLCIKEDFKGEEKFIYLKKEIISNKEMLAILINEINEMKNIKKQLLKKKENENEEKKENEDYNINILLNKIKHINEEIIKKYKEKEELEFNIKLLTNGKNIGKMNTINKIKDTNEQNFNDNKNIIGNQKQKYKNEILLQMKIDYYEKVYFLYDKDGLYNAINQLNIDLFINNIKYDFRNNFFEKNILWMGNYIL